MGFISRSTPSPWRSFRGNIPGSTGKVVDTSSNTFNSLTYYIMVQSNANNEARALEYRLLREGTVYKSSVDGKLGGLKIGVSDDVVSGKIELTITNNETFPIEYRLTVLKV